MTTDTLRTALEAHRSEVSAWLHEWDIDLPDGAWGDLDIRLGALTRAALATQPATEPSAARRLREAVGRRDASAAIAALDALPAPKPSAALVEAVVNARCVSFPKCDPGAARSVHDPRCIAARSALRADLDAIVTAARAEGLDAAWAEVERLLPEGWWLGGVQRYGGRWAAAAWGPAPEWPRCHAEADDPIIALRNLALALAARRTPEVE